MSEGRVLPKLFIILADPEIKEDTLCKKIFNMSLEVIKNQGYQYEITDLAKDGWNDVISVKDFVKVSDPVHINMMIEQQTSTLITKIQEEQEKFKNCELLLIFGPLSWFGLSSHFYSYWERVITCGAMYAPGHMFDQGILSKKRAMLIMTSSLPQEKFGRETSFGYVEEILYPITHGMLHAVGFRIHRTQTLFAPTPEKFKEIQNKWPMVLRGINDRAFLQFNQAKDYLNWQLNTPESDRKNDLEILHTRSIDMSLQESSM